jgi:hypothetical protein
MHFGGFTSHWSEKMYKMPKFEKTLENTGFFNTLFTFFHHDFPQNCVSKPLLVTQGF